MSDGSGGIARLAIDVTRPREADSVQRFRRIRRRVGRHGSMRHTPTQPNKAETATKRRPRRHEGNDDDEGPKAKGEKRIVDPGGRGVTTGYLTHVSLACTFEKNIKRNQEFGRGSPALHLSFRSARTGRGLSMWARSRRASYGLVSEHRSTAVAVWTGASRVLA
jgi:hypothetical protein